MIDGGLTTLPAALVQLSEAEDGSSALAMTRQMQPLDPGRHPALAMPIPAAIPYPMSLQLVGRRGDDARFCAIAARIESILQARLPQAQ